MKLKYMFEMKQTIFSKGKKAEFGDSINAFPLNIYQYQANIYDLVEKGDCGRELIMDTSGLFILPNAYFTFHFFSDFINFGNMKFMTGKCF